MLDKTRTDIGWNGMERNDNYAGDDVVKQFASMNFTVMACRKEERFFFFYFVSLI
jgi:hypothetical protein